MPRPSFLPFGAIIWAVVMGSLAPGEALAQHEIPSPDHWVAFEADFTLTFADGREIRGHFNRAADGSRRKTEKGSGRPAYAVSIDNFSEQMAFTMTSSGRWSSHAMQLGGRVPPPQMRMTAAFTKLPELLEGLEVYRWESDSGQVSTVAPALNFFALVAETSQYRLRYRNVKLGDQPASLFRPPASARVTNEAGIGGTFRFYPSVTLRVAFGPDDVQQIKPVGPNIVEVRNRAGKGVGIRAIVTDIDRGSVQIEVHPLDQEMPAQPEQLEAVLGESVSPKNAEPDVEIDVESIAGRYQ